MFEIWRRKIFNWISFICFKYYINEDWSFTFTFKCDWIDIRSKLLQKTVQNLKINNSKMFVINVMIYLFINNLNLQYEIIFWLLIRNLETDKDPLRFQMNFISFILFQFGIQLIILTNIWNCTLENI